MSDQIEFAITYTSARHPHGVGTEVYPSLEEAQAAYARRFAEGRVGDLKLVAPTEKVAEAHADNAGNVLVLVKEARGYWRTDVWRCDAFGFHSETISLHQSNRRATSQLMWVHAGLCAAERTRRVGRQAA